MPAIISVSADNACGLFHPSSCRFFLLYFLQRIEDIVFKGAIHHDTLRRRRRVLSAQVAFGRVCSIPDQRGMLAQYETVLSFRLFNVDNFQRVCSAMHTGKITAGNNDQIAGLY